MQTPSNLSLFSERTPVVFPIFVDPDTHRVLAAQLDSQTNNTKTRAMQQTAKRSASNSATVLTKIPAVLCDVLLCGPDGFVLEWCCHGVIESVHEPKVRHNGNDFHDL